MMDQRHAELLAFFDVAIDKIRAHASYGRKLADAAQEQRELILNFHTHGPGQGYCTSICVLEGGVPLIGLPGELTELVHLRAIARTLEECDPFMEAFADKLVERYALTHRPITWVDGNPRAV
ncbi:MAG: hypothetical protein ABIP42_02610 [Planctomycetota bacterium]